MPQTNRISPIEVPISLYQQYNEDDKNLIEHFSIEENFNISRDRIEYLIKNFNSETLFFNSNFTNYRIKDNKVEINPVDDLNDADFYSGNFIVNYKFFTDLFNSSEEDVFYISEISSNRTEIRVKSNSINIADIESDIQEVIDKLNNDPNYNDFLIKIENQIYIIGLNLKFEQDSILIKLYQPLPNQFNVKDTLFFTQKLSDSITYDVSLVQDIVTIDTTTSLRGPNINLNLNNQVNTSTEFKSKQTLTQSPLKGLEYQLKNILKEKAIEINVDYNDFKNFIKFSSINLRIKNFIEKLKLIEEYELKKSESVITEKLWETKIDEIISNFDGYENFLYYTDSSNAYPKSSINPLTLEPVADTDTWQQERLSTSQDFDQNNPEYLLNNLPQYLQDTNRYEFAKQIVSMLGQHFDNIWVYTKDITNKFDTDNRINFGISKDLVTEVIKEFGIKIYENNFSTQDLYNAFLGKNNDGSFDLPSNSTNQLPVNTGSFEEYIDTYVTSSDTPIPLDDVNKRIYKRIFHNIPYLLKTKGTKRGLEALLNIYGIPQSILRIDNFGNLREGMYDHWYEIYNKALTNTEVKIPFNLNPQWNTPNNKPQAISFRFKINEDISKGTVLSLFELEGYKFQISYDGVPNLDTIENIDLSKYTRFIVTDIQDDELLSISLPLLNKDWWTLYIQYDLNSLEILTNIQNKEYTGNDRNNIGFTKTESFTDGDNIWEQTNDIIIPSLTQIDLQEFRLYVDILSTKQVDNLTMNPLSIEGEIAFRTSLGSLLDTNSTSSIHPKIHEIDSFDNGSDFTYITSPLFNSNNETVFLNPFFIGIRDRSSNKIFTQESPIFEDILSRYASIQENEKFKTNDVNQLEVVFSPQNKINDDIVSNFGYFNIGDIIGDPREKFNTKTYYTELNKIRDEYFKKYKDSYDVKDFIRLIRYFDNSLFKLIKDFVPAKKYTTTGLLVKPHYLERTKHPQPQLDIKQLELSSSVEEIYDFKGKTGGVLDRENKLPSSQSFDVVLPTIAGNVNIIKDDQSEFYNGEYPLSNIIVSDGENNPENPFKFSSPDTAFDVLYGNTTEVTQNPKSFTLDYTLSDIQPKNLEAILSGSATNSFNQLYNYNILRHTRPRYKGSKNTTDAVNSRRIQETKTINKNQNINLQPSILGKPSVEIANNAILEFDWGGGSPPEIQNAGAMRIRQLLLVGNNRDEVVVIPNTQDGFFSIVEQLFPTNSTPEITQYQTNSEITNARVLQVGWATPSQAKYMIAGMGDSDDINFRLTSSGAALTTSSEWTLGEADENSRMRLVSKNNSGQYITGSVISGSEFFEDLSSSLAEGEEWYLTGYRRLGNIIIDNNDVSLEPMNRGRTKRNEKGEYNFPLEKNGVFKITEVDPDNYKLTLKNFSDHTPIFGDNSSNTGAGCLIWKSTQGDFIQFNDSTLSRMGKGAMTTQTPSKVIQENLEYITKTYGQNS